MQSKLFAKLLGEWAHDNSPVFVVGPERSGTSLLFQQVCNHPAFCDFSEATVETFCFTYPWKLIGDASPDNYELRLYVGHDNWQAFQDSINFVIEANNEADARGLPKEYLYQENRPKIWESRKYGALLRTFFYFAWQHLGKKCIVEKTPAHIRSLPEIYDVFPNASVLVCVREPAEIIASHRKRYAKEVELGKDKHAPELHWLNKPLDEFLGYFKEVDDIIRYHQKQARRILVVPYIELTENAQDTMQSIFEFVGVDESSVNEEKARPHQHWDPLLNQAPQVNNIDVESFLSHREIEQVKKLKECLVEAWR